MIDFTSVEKTGLKKSGELDKIFGVSRLMVINYTGGKAQPRKPNSHRIQVAVRVLNDLVEAGKLPLAEGKTKEQRAQAVDKIVEYVIKKMQ